MHDDPVTLLGDLAATSAAVASTPARSGKVAVLAELLRRLEPAEIEPAVGFLIGSPRQGKVGVGWGHVGSIESSPAPEASLTVADLDAAIDRLQAVGGPGSVAARKAELTALLSAATPGEVDLIRAVLLGDIRQGALDGVMTAAVAKAAGVTVAAVRRAAMLAGDLLSAAAAALNGGAAALAAGNLEVGRPVLPMLASTAVGVADAIAELGESSVEWKLDGARIQAHRAGDVVHLYTRNQNEVTDRLPAVVDVVLQLAATGLILDGEVVGVDIDDERPDAFQDTMSRFSRHHGGGHGLVVRFFDCLYADGRSLLDEPLVERVAVLGRVAGPWAIAGRITADPGEAAAVLDEALAAGHEGVVVKAVGSTYEAGRRGKAWRKVKPVRTLDLVVLAAEWGYGRREGLLSNLHLGARDPAGGFVMVGKTFKGLTDAMLTWQTERLLALEVERRGIQVHVRPELVVEIAVDAAQSSTRYPGGVTLRFARVKRYRDDKGPDEADTIDAVRSLLPGPLSARPPSVPVDDPPRTAT